MAPPESRPQPGRRRSQRLRAARCALRAHREPPASRAEASGQPSAAPKAPAAPDLLQALQASGGIVVMTDAARRITWVNAAFSRLTGYGLDEARGRSPGELLQFEGTCPQTVARMRECLNAGQGYRGVVRNRDRKGRVYWLDLDIQPIMDDAGRTCGYIALQSDVTETRQDQDHLRAIVNSAVAGVIALDAQGVITGTNPEAERLLEMPESSLIGRPARHAGGRLVDEDGQWLAPADTAWVRAMATGAAQQGQIVGLRLRGGRRRWLRVSSQRIPGPTEGSLAVVSSFTDVTASRQAAALLAAERERLRAALEGTRAGVWEWNLATGEAHADERWAEIGGRTLAELEPVSFATWLGLLHPEDRPALDRALHAHRLGETAFFDAECRMQHKQGHWVWVALRGRRAPAGEPGRRDSMHGTIMDITASKRAALALLNANTQLQGLFDLSPVGMALSRLDDGAVLECNDAQVALLGYSRQQIVGLQHRDLLPPEGKDLARQFRSQLLEGGRFGPSETDMLHATGRRVPVLLSGMLVKLADGSQRLWSLMQDLSLTKNMEQRLRNEARTDRLTGLPNRALLMERLEQCVARAAADPTQRFSLLFLDFDRFKLVNDTLGHDAGDQLLQIIADRLRGALRARDTRGDGGSLVARLGGDEFVVLLADARSADAAVDVARRLLDVLAAPYLVQGKEIHSSASIGIVLGDAESGSATCVLRNADTAMYEAKRSGRGNCALFDQAMLVRVSRAVQVEAALRKAIGLDQLSVVYQPIVDLNTGSMASAEALLRWQHPVLGAVSPAEFIPIAEDSGLIVPIGEWVLWQACRQWREWQRESPALAPATVSVNLSRVQMALGDRLLALVSQVLEELEMPPGCLQLEVTEREVVRDPAVALRLMHRLRELGVKLAMDDFGTGASSLGCLRDYPFDVIKIDKSFIDDLGTSPALLAVLHGTVTVIHNLGMVSVAEGIEEEVQVGVLQSLGCRYGQGYRFARPVPGNRLLTALQPLATAA